MPKNIIDIEESERKEILYKANIERAFVATIMQALDYYIDNMIKFCKDNDIRIDSFEKSQLKLIKSAIRNITTDYKSLEQDKSESFKNYSKIIAVTIQELFSRTDGDLMSMYKFYNYIKLFPIKHASIDITAEIEKDAFSVLFNK